MSFVLFMSILVQSYSYQSVLTGKQMNAKNGFPNLLLVIGRSVETALQLEVLRENGREIRLAIKTCALRLVSNVIANGV